jgi:hypothetical protein
VATSLIIEQIEFWLENGPFSKQQLTVDPKTLQNTTFTGLCGNLPILLTGHPNEGMRRAVSTLAGKKQPDLPYVHDLIRW